MVEVTIEDVAVRVGPDEGGEKPRVVKPHRIVLLRERGGSGRLLPIWVGEAEGDALALHRGGVSTPRPLTHELTVRLLEAAGTRIERVTVASLRENIFYALVALRAGEEVNEIDARPSDALNVAVRADAPIYVDAALMDDVGIATDDVFRSLDEELARHHPSAEDEPGEWHSISSEVVVLSRWPSSPPT
jgi:bifunctional DNase/RNase